jgi:hypothetical protein
MLWLAASASAREVSAGDGGPMAVREPEDGPCRCPEDSQGGCGVCKYEHYDICFNATATATATGRRTVKAATADSLMRYITSPGYPSMRCAFPSLPLPSLPFQARPGQAASWWK